jgi:hypothetical protein
MGIKVVFQCDHEGCEVTYTLDTSHVCGNECDGTANGDVPITLEPVVRYLTDDVARGGHGWEVAADRHPPPPGVKGAGPLLLLRKCFCAEHADDVKSMPGYEPDDVARRHARRAH